MRQQLARFAVEDTVLHIEQGAVLVKGGYRGISLTAGTLHHCPAALTTSGRVCVGRELFGIVAAVVACGVAHSVQRNVHHPFHHNVLRPACAVPAKPRRCFRYPDNVLADGRNEPRGIAGVRHVRHKRRNGVLGITYVVRRGNLRPIGKQDQARLRYARRSASRLRHRDRQQLEVRE